MSDREPVQKSPNEPQKEDDGHALDAATYELIVDQLREAGIDEEKALNIAGIAMRVSGPIPDPWLLEKYEKLTPGTADRLVRMVEIEGAHVREMERREQDAEIKDLQAMRSAEKRGQTSAVIVCLLAFAFAAIALAIAPNAAGAVVASVIGGGALASIVIALIVGRQRPVS